MSSYELRVAVARASVTVAEFARVRAETAISAVAACGRPRGNVLVTGRSCSTHRDPIVSTAHPFTEHLLRIILPPLRPAIGARRRAPGIFRV